MSVGEFNKDRALPFVAASHILPYQPVGLDTGAAKRQVVPLAANTGEPQGLNGPATALQGESVTIYELGAVVEAIANASVGAGADVGVASSNGGHALVSGASGVTRYRTGKTLEPAAAGERFSLYVSPKQVSNLI